MKTIRIAVLVSTIVTLSFASPASAAQGHDIARQGGPSVLVSKPECPGTGLDEQPAGTCGVF